MATQLLPVRGRQKYKLITNNNKRLVNLLGRPIEENQEIRNKRIKINKKKHFGHNGHSKLIQLVLKPIVASFNVA